jgi:cytochrome P450
MSTRVVSAQTVVRPHLPEHNQDPYPMLRELQEQAPVVWIGDVQRWWVTGYDEIKAVMRDNATFQVISLNEYFVNLQDTDLGDALPRLQEQFGRLIGFSNPPVHPRLRRLLASAFATMRPTRLEPQIRSVADQLLDDLDGRETIDFIDEFAFLLPVYVISAMLGMPIEDRSRFGTFADALTTGFDPAAGRDALDRMVTGWQELDAYFTDMIADRRARPQDDLVSALVHAEVDGDRLNPDELLGNIGLFYWAGHTTTMHTLGSTLVELTDDPDALAVLREDGMTDTAVEELIRFVPPVRNQPRIAVRDAELGGERILAGDTLTCELAAGNRDPRAFENAGRLDLRRTPNRHLTFGHGAHSCLGAPLARLELKVAFEAILDRWQSWELVEPTVHYTDNFLFHGPTTLPLRVTWA